MKRILVEGKNIGVGCPCFVIAEASSNHGKSFKRAKKMIEAAARAGADAVKFQIFTAETLAVDTKDQRTVVKVKEKSVFVDKDTKLIDLYRPNELPRSWLPKLAAYARKQKIIFLATPFDEQAVDQLEAVAVPLYKVASYEMQDVPLLRKIAATKKPILLSTGMADLHEITDSLKILKRAKSGPVILLHCRSIYPTPVDQVDLSAMETMRRKFRLPVGFSDHTLGIGVPVGAVSLGAVVVEKHFILNDGISTIDDKFSLTPNELAIMIQAIRQAQAAIGSSVKRPTKIEVKEKLLAARSLWVVEDMRKGETFNTNNLKSLRPGIGLSPMLFDQVLGKRAKRDITKNSPLKRSDY